MKSLKEMRAALFTLYNVMKESKGCDPVQILRDHFADELYTEAVAELKGRIDTAASGTALLTGTQALALKARGRLMERLNLKFRESPEQLLESMAGFEVFDFGIDKVDGKDVLALHRTNGITESTVYADIPDLEEGQILFVLEPFGTIGDEEKTWTEMTAEEREKAAGNIRNASSLPKRMMKRRAKVKSIDQRFDNRTGWLEIHYEEIEPYSRSTQELDALTEEFHPSKEVKEETAESAKRNEADIPTEEQIEQMSGGVDASGIEDDDLHSELQEQSATSADDLDALAGSSSDELELPE